MKVCIGISFSGLNYELYLIPDPTVLLIWKKKKPTNNEYISYISTLGPVQPFKGIECPF